MVATSKAGAAEATWACSPGAVSSNAANRKAITVHLARSLFFGGSLGRLLLHANGSSGKDLHAIYLRASLANTLVGRPLVPFREGAVGLARWIAASLMCLLGLARASPI